MFIAAPRAVAVRAPTPTATLARGTRRSVSVAAARSHAVTTLAGDGIGPEIMEVALACLKASTL